MRVPLSWIEEFVRPGVKPEQLADLLTRTGTEVSQLERRQAHFAGVVVGRVKTVIKHPSADRLKVCKVAVAPGTQAPLSMVCGAPNVAPEQTVAVALPGATIAAGTVVERAAIRGVESAGMICSARELGLGDDPTGILVLGDDLELGVPLADALALNEVIFHFELTPNRADCFSVQGLGREIAALTGRAFWPATAKIREPGKPTKQSIAVRIADHKLATRYVARVVRGVAVKESPQWLKNRLEASGVRPVNTVVDVTNYVMLELGQPLHAFDWHRIQGRRLTVRAARRGEQLLMLDGTTRVVPTGSPVIADAKQALVVAGIMGGQGSGISAKTRDIVIESATFDPVAIRKASQALALRTEASQRHDKGPDPATVRLAADRAAHLIAELAGGEVAAGIVEAGSAPAARQPISVSLPWLSSLLGVRLQPAQAQTILERLGFAMSSGQPRTRVGRRQTTGAGWWRLTPPTWRGDVRIPEDVVEEVGRVLDYNTFPKTLPPSALPPVTLPAIIRLEDAARAFFVRSGFSEVLTYPYYGDQHRQLFGLTGVHIEPLNPLSPDQAYLRQRLAPRLVEAVGRNRPQRETLRLFEIGSTFVARGKAVDEQRVLGLVALAPDAARLLRGAAESFLATGGIAVEVQVNGDALVGSLQGKAIVRLQGVAPAVADACKLRTKHPVAVLEVQLEPLATMWQSVKTFTPYSTYPAVTRDVAFWLPAPQPYGPVHDAMRGSDPLLVSAELFDVFATGDRMSYAVRLTLHAADRTLTADEVEAALAKVRQLLSSQFRAELRS